MELGNPVGRCRMTRANQKGHKGDLEMLRQGAIDNRFGKRDVQIGRMDNSTGFKQRDVRKKVDDNMQRIFGHSANSDKPIHSDSRTGRHFKQDWVGGNSIAGADDIMQPTVGDHASWGDETGRSAKERYQDKRKARGSKQNQSVRQRYSGRIEPQSSEGFGCYTGWKKSADSTKKSKISVKPDNGNYEHTQNHPKSRNNAQIYGDDAEESDDEYAKVRADFESAYEAKEKKDIEEKAKKIAEAQKSAATTEFEERFKTYLPKSQQQSVNTNLSYKSKSLNISAKSTPQSEWKKPEKSPDADKDVEQTVKYVDDLRGMIRGMPIEFGKKYESDHYTTFEQKGTKLKKPQRCNGFDMLKTQILKKSEPKTPSIFSNRARTIEEMPTFVLKPKKSDKKPNTVNKVYPVVNALQEMCQLQYMPTPTYRIERTGGSVKVTLSCQDRVLTLFELKDAKKAKYAAADIMLSGFYEEHKILDTTEKFLKTAQKFTDKNWNKKMVEHREHHLANKKKKAEENIQLIKNNEAMDEELKSSRIKLLRKHAELIPQMPEYTELCVNYVVDGDSEFRKSFIMLNELCQREKMKPEFKIRQKFNQNDVINGPWNKRGSDAAEREVTVSLRVCRFDVSKACVFEKEETRKLIASQTNVHEFKAEIADKAIKELLEAGLITEQTFKNQKKPCDFKSEKVNAGKNWASNNKSNPRSRRHNYDKRTDGKGKKDASFFINNNKKPVSSGRPNGNLSGKFNNANRGKPVSSSSGWGYDSNKGGQKNSAGHGVQNNPTRYDLRKMDGNSHNRGGRGGGNMGSANMGSSNMGHSNMGNSNMGNSNMGNANMGNMQTTMQQLMQQNMQMQQQMNQMMGMSNNFQAGEKRSFGYGNNNNRGNNRGKRGRW